MAGKSRTIIAGIALIAFAGLIYYSTTKDDLTAADSTMSVTDTVAMVQVSVPTLEGNAVLGERAFNANCASCHGDNAAGQKGVAPPLIHSIYRPAHHGDMAFFFAAQNGVRAHHWKFGNMPPVEGITKAEMTTIVAYIRALQSANGVF